MAEKLPVIFVGHGSPMNALEHMRARAAWEKLGSMVPRPRAIVILSAHFATRGIYVNVAQPPEQVYDMYGFPDELYQIHYEPALAEDVAECVLADLAPLGARATTEWGLDHGAWAPLTAMFPQADIPVVCVSTPVDADVSKLARIGEALAHLRDEGVLILVTGNIVHNLREAANQEDGFAWEEDGRKLVKKLVFAHDLLGIQTFLESELGQMCAPTPEHFYPLLEALGAVSADEQVRIFNDWGEMGSIAMTSFVLGQLATL